MAASPASGLRAYEHLSPDAVLDALAAVGLAGDGRILQLNSYENRVFQVMLEGGDAVVAKFYRPGRWSDEQIVEEHRFALELAAAEVPVVAPLPLAAHRADVALLPRDEPRTLALRAGPHEMLRFAAAPRRAGRTPELEDEAVLARLGGFIGRLHAVGRRAAFAHRPKLDAASDARTALALLLDGDFVPHEQVAPWRKACARAIEVIDAAVAAAPPRTLRLHGDCHRGNLLWRDEGAHIVDLDDCCTGPAVQDLWMLLAGDAPSMAAQLHALLAGYEVFMPFDRRELALIEPLRLVRMMRHNAWVARRWSDPAFPLAYPDFGTSAYWAQQCTQLREQTATARDGPPLAELL